MVEQFETTERTPEQWHELACQVAAIVGPHSAAAQALRRYDEMLTAGHDARIFNIDNTWFVGHE